MAPQQAAALAANGAALGQGYWFSRPVPASETAALLGARWSLPLSRMVAADRRRHGAA